MPLLRFRAELDDAPPHVDEQGHPCRCRELDGLEAPAGDPIWLTSMPPLHEGCRCIVDIQVLAGELIGHTPMKLGWLPHSNAVRNQLDPARRLLVRALPFLQLFYDANPTATGTEADELADEIKAFLKGP